MESGIEFELFELEVKQFEVLRTKYLKTHADGSKYWLYNEMTPAEQKFKDGYMKRKIASWGLVEIEQSDEEKIRNYPKWKKDQNQNVEDYRYLRGGY